MSLRFIWCSLVQFWHRPNCHMFPKKCWKHFMTSYPIEINSKLKAIAKCAFMWKHGQFHSRVDYFLWMFSSSVFFFVRQLIMGYLFVEYSFLTQSAVKRKLRKMFWTLFTTSLSHGSGNFLSSKNLSSRHTSTCTDTENTFLPTKAFSSLRASST